MKVTAFIARKLEFKGKLAVVSIAISFLVMIAALAITSGFRGEIRDGISRLAGDVMIAPRNADYLSGTVPVRRDYDFLRLVESLDGVSDITPVVYRAGIVKGARDIDGAIFKGTNKYDSLQVAVPQSLADALSIVPGDRIQCYFIGEKVKVRNFTVKDVYEDLAGAEDKPLIYAGLSDLQRLNEWDEDEVSAIEIKAGKGFDDRRSLDNLASEIGTIVLAFSDDIDDMLLVRSSASRYPQIFAWLDLVDFNVFIVLILMTIVAGFNMVSGLLILLFRSISTIGVLKSMGMTDKSIAIVFLRVASRIVLKGMAIGNAIALAFCIIQGWTHLIKLNPANYFISYVPVQLHVLPVIAVDVIAWVVIMLVLTLPCMFISRVDPSKTVSVR